MTWILTIILASGIMVPIADFASEQDCHKAQDMWTLEPGVEIVCLSAEEAVGAPKQRIKRRRHRRDD
jgi:hypothetical protein